MKIVYSLAEDGEGRYASMARVSVASVRATNPGITIEVVCDPESDRILGRAGNRLRGEVDRWLVAETPSDRPVVRNRHLKTRLRSLVKGPFLYLDADTFVRGDLSCLADLQCDIALARNHSRPKISDQIWEEDASASRAMGWPIGHTTYANGGVVFYRDTAAARAFAEDWHRAWLSSVERTGRPQDQPALNHVLDTCGVDWCLLEDRYNAQFRTNGSVSSGAVVLHYYASDPLLPCAAERLATELSATDPIDPNAIAGLIQRDHPWRANNWIDEWVARQAVKHVELGDAHRLWLAGRRVSGIRRWLTRSIGLGAA